MKRSYTYLAVLFFLISGLFLTCYSDCFASESSEGATFIASAQEGETADEKEGDLEEEVSLRLYPNPASEDINVDYSGENLKKVRLISLTGQTISSEDNPSDNSHTFKVKDLEKGIYIVEVEGEENSFARRVVIE